MLFCQGSTLFLVVEIVLLQFVTPIIKLKTILAAVWRATSLAPLVVNRRL